MTDNAQQFNQGGAGNLATGTNSYGTNGVVLAPGYDSQGNSVYVSNPALNPQLPSSTVSVSGLVTPQTPINIPPAATVDTGATANASIPTPQSIVDNANAPTGADTQQSDLLKQIANLTGGQQSLATQQINQEGVAGVPALATTLRSLSAQLQGQNDQLSKLQVDASAGGTIQNANQEAAIGRGRTVGGNAPLLAGDLRKNQIQQASIATQALTTKAAYYAANNDYLNAKDAADKAAQVAFDATDQEIKHQQALLAAIQPQLNKEQTTRAALLSAQLQDRQTQIANQRDDFKTGQGLAITAMKNNPSDAQAQFAAQQALKLDPKDPNYRTKVANLVGKYQDNATQTALDTKLKQAQVDKIYNDIKVANANLNGTNAPDVQTTYTGLKYVDTSGLSGDAKNAAIKSAAKAGIPAVTPDQAGALNDIDNARLNQDAILNQIKTFLPKDAAGRITAGPSNKLSQFIQTNDQLGAFNSWRTAAINTLRATAGSKGLRINQAEILAATENDIPQITDTLGVAQQKYNNIMTLLGNAEKAILVSDRSTFNPNSTSGVKTGTLPDGTAVTQNADGSITDAKGNKYDTNGNKL